MISAEKFVNNAAVYIDIFHLWLSWKGAPPFVQSAIAILEKVVEHPITAPFVISALRNVPGFAGVAVAVAEGGGSIKAAVPKEFEGMEFHLFEVSSSIIDLEKES